jgi:hypothetical protein
MRTKRKIVFKRREKTSRIKALGEQSQRRSVSLNCNLLAFLSIIQHRQAFKISGIG